jgi:Na+(H+)/acetate symporter ActP
LERDVDITWVAIISAIVMGTSAAIIVLFFVKHERIQPSSSAERAFWSKLEQLARSAPGPSRSRTRPRNA